MSGARIQPTPAYVEECDEESEYPVAGTKISASAPRTPNEPELREPLQPASPHTSSDDLDSPPRISRRDRRASRHRSSTRERSYERVREQSEHREAREKRREKAARRSSVHRSAKDHRNSYHDDMPYDQQLTRTRSHSNRTPFPPGMAPPPAQYPPPPNNNYYPPPPSQMIPPPNGMFPPPNLNMPPPPNMNMNMGPGGIPNHMGPPMPIQNTPQMMPPPGPNMPGGNYGFPHQNYGMPALPHTPGSDHYDLQSAQTQRLSQRLAPARPVSAMAIRRDSHHYDERPDFLGHGNGSTTRRSSVRRRNDDDDRRRFDDDKRKMPPPGGPPLRPKSARPASGAFSRPIPIERSHLRNRSSVCEEDDLDYDYYPPGSPADHDDYITAGTRARRESINYGNGRMITQRARRPSSYYQESPHGLSSSYHDKDYNDQARTAQAYMNLTNSMKQLELTDESLRKVNRQNYYTGGSSRSTRSGGSRGDESEWRQPSVTTHTTRSSDEEFTIKVQKGGIVSIDGQNIECQDGTELTISASRPLEIRSPHEQNSRLALEAPLGSYYDGQHYDDRRLVRGERERGIQRHRANSQANSFSRGSFDRNYDAPIYNYNGVGRY